MPGRSGLSQRTSSMPGAPMELRVENEAVGDDPHQQAAGVPARGAQAAEQRGARRRLVEMHRLRIELGGEGDDLLARHQPRAVDGDRAGFEVFPMSFGMAAGLAQYAFRIDR